VLARNISVLAGSQLTTWCAAAAWTLVIPRTLGASQTGIYTLAVASGGVLTVMIGLGMRPLLVREIALDRSRAGELIATAIIVRALVALPVLGLTIGFTRVAGLDHDQATATVLGWGMCIFYVLYEPIQAGLQAVERMEYLAYSDIITKGAVSIAAIALVLGGVRAIGLVVTSIAVMGVTLVLNMLWMRRHFRLDWRIPRRRLLALARDSLPYWGFAAFFTIYLWIDSLMLAVMTTSTEVGWYGMPTKLFGTLMFIPVILSTAWLPQLVTAFRDGRLWTVARASVQAVVMLSLPIAAATVVVAGPMVHLLYGSGFDGSVAVLTVLGITIPPMYLNIMVNQVLVAAQRQMVWTRVMMMASVLNPLLNLGLIRYFQSAYGNGAIGAAVALLITEIVIAGVGVVLIRQSFDRAGGSRMLRTAAATLGMVGAMVALRSHGVALQLVGGAIVLVLLAIVLRAVGPDEWRQAQLAAGVVSRRLRRSRQVAT
jgi:O-antigen/teichoic acid export membrane protein